MACATGFGKGDLKFVATSSFRMSILCTSIEAHVCNMIAEIFTP